jgi:hypothetical protein
MPAAVRIPTRARKAAATDPQNDPRFKRVVEQLKAGSTKLKQHPTPAKKAAEVAAAAKGPPNEKKAGGQAKQVDKIQEAPTKKPESGSFLALLRAEIEKAMPKTLGDTEKFMKGGSAEGMKGSLKGNVGQQKEQAAGDVKSASKQAPSEGGVQGKQVTAIPGEPASAPPAVDGAAAMPAPKPDAEVSLQDSKKDTDQAMKDAEVTDTQLQKANDPRFSAVASAKGAVAQQADAAPAAYRGNEKAALAQATAKAGADAKKNSAAMAGAKSSSKSAVLTRQQAAKAKDEAARKKVADDIEAIYNETKKNVELKLSTLETDVERIFDSGTDAALAAMKDYVEDRIFKYKLERYLSIPVVGAARWIKDQFMGLPPEVDAFYVEGRNLFTRLMDKMVVQVANLVETRLKEAKQEVANGQTKIKTYVAGLPKNLQSVGQAAQKEVAGRFEELERGIDEKKNQLAQQLADKYKEAFEKADKALKEIQDSNKGLVAAFVEKLGEVIKALTEFKARLMSVIKKGEEAIKLVLADPIGFLGNLLAALKQGFNQFVSNIWTHLKKGFMTWLFGELTSTGIAIPSDLSLASILKLVLSVLGLTWERARAEAVKMIGPTAVTVIEKLVEYIQAMWQGGPAALWEKVKEDLSNLKAMVIDAIQDWLITTIVKRAVAKIVTMFNPAGAIIQAIMMIYSVVTFIIERANQILDFVEAVINSIAAIAKGAIGGAATWIENALGRLVPVLIGVLASLIGLGGIGAKIKEYVTKAGDLVWGAIRKLLKKAIAFVKKMWGKLTGKGKDKDKDTPESKDVKAKVKAELSGKQVTDKKQEHALITSVYNKYQAMGLKGIKFTKKPGADIDVVVSASLAEKVASLTYKDLSKLLTIARNMNPYGKKTTIYISYDDGKSFGSVKDKKGEGHAETRFKNKVLPNLLAKIKKDRKKLKTPVGQPVPVTLDINRTPCDGCSQANLVAIANSVAASADPDQKIRLIVNAASIYKADWRSHEQTSIESVIAMKDKGIEINASKIWEAIEAKLKQFAQFEWNGKMYADWEIRIFKSEAPDVQSLIDDAVKKINDRPPKEEKKGM